MQHALRRVLSGGERGEVGENGGGGDGSDDHRRAAADRAKEGGDFATPAPLGRGFLRAAAEAADVPSTPQGTNFSYAGVEIPSTSRQVQTSLNVLRVFDASTVEQTFGVSLLITMVWELPEWENPPAVELDDGDWIPEWTPKYRIRKVMHIIYEAVSYTLETIDGRKCVCMDVEHVLRLYQRFDLRNFPVDTQTFDIELESRLDITRYHIVPLTSEKSPSVSVLLSAIDLPDFSIQNRYPFTRCVLAKQLPRRLVTGVTVSLKVERKAQFYLFNMATLGLVTTCALCTWAIHPAEVGSRHNNDFNLVIAAIAYKLYLSNLLPPISHVTMLDIYTLGSFTFNLVVVAAHTLVILKEPLAYLLAVSPLTLPPNLWEEDGDEEDLISLDRKIFWASCALWVLFNIWWAGMVVSTRRRGVREQLEQSRKETAVYRRSASFQDVRRGSATERSMSRTTSQLSWEG